MATPVNRVPRSAMQIGDRLIRRGLKPSVIALRRRYYVTGAGVSVLDRLPVGMRRRLGLDDDAARVNRSIEIGGGRHPHQGYVHVDMDPDALHLEARAAAWALPFPDGWATEILAIHVLEHIPPKRLDETLREWHRVLGPDGVIRVHVPNTPAIMRAYLGAPATSPKWALSAALLGQYGGPDVSRPEDISVPSDHQSLFDYGLLRNMLMSAGFKEVVDLTDFVTDRHTDGWQPLVARCSLVVEARTL